MNLDVYDLIGKVNIEGIEDNTIYSIAMEECCELAQSISKINRGKADLINTSEEIADVLICISWVLQKNNIPREDIEDWIDFKMTRSKKNIESGNFK